MVRTDESRPFKATLFAFAAISPLLVASFASDDDALYYEGHRITCLHCFGDDWIEAPNYESERARIAYPHRVAAGSTDDQLFLHIFAVENEYILKSQSEDDVAAKPVIAMGLAKGMPKRPIP